MAELKTKKTEASVDAFLAKIPDAQARADSKTLVQLMKAATGSGPKMWGPSIVGFGDYHYKYESGREGDWFVMGFSPRKASLTLYFMCGLQRLAPHLEKLGKHKTGKVCLYVKRLEDVNPGVLGRLVKSAAAAAKGK